MLLGSPFVLLERSCWVPHNEVSAPEVLYALNNNDFPTPIYCIHSQDGVEVVGITQSLMGDSSPSLKVLKNKANLWQEILKSNFLPCSLLWRTLFHVLWPLLQYSLAVSSFSPTQTSQIVSWLYQTLLPWLGVNWHFPLALHYASPKYHGLGLLNPFWEQGISALSLFLEHTNADSMESTLSTLLWSFYIWNWVFLPLFSNYHTTAGCFLLQIAG